MHFDRQPAIVEQPSLLKTIIDTAVHGSSSHDNRHTDVYRCIKSLYQLEE